MWWLYVTITVVAVVTSDQPSVPVRKVCLTPADVAALQGRDRCGGERFLWRKDFLLINQNDLSITTELFYLVWGGIKRRGNKPEHLIRLYLMRIIWWEPSLHHPEHGATDVPHKSISSEDNLHYWVSFSVIVSRMVCILCQTPSGDCTENMMFIVLLLLIFYLVNW